MGLPHEEVEQVVLGVSLHDIGTDNKPALPLCPYPWRSDERDPSLCRNAVQFRSHECVLQFDGLVVRSQPPRLPKTGPGKSRLRSRFSSPSTTRVIGFTHPSVGHPSMVVSLDGVGRHAALKIVRRVRTRQRTKHLEHAAARKEALGMPPENQRTGRISHQRFSLSSRSNS